MSNHKRNTSGLVKAAEKMHADMVSRVNDAIEYVQANNEALNFNNIATVAKVSKAWLYRQPKLKEKISRLRSECSNEGLNQAPHKKDYEFIINQLKRRNKSLSDENAILKKQVERMYGELHNLKKANNFKAT